ncbi:MAG: glycosyltransferase family 2 protein [Deltaproteobacteria bacterium]|nr:glycosyltransferase family 2 protein [Deltaproteobacteria bacterium]
MTVRAARGSGVEFYDGAGWRLAERAIRRVTAARKAMTARRRSPEGSRQPTGRPKPDRGWEARELEVAATGGDYERAQELAHGLLARGGVLGLAVLPILEVLVAVGDTARAGELAQANLRLLLASARGVGLIEVLRDAGVPIAPPPRALPDGRLNVVAISRAVEARELSGEDVDRLLDRHRLAVLRSPDLHLLAFMAHRRSDPSAALRALNRFFRAQGLPCASWGERTGHLLRDLRFATGGPDRSGPLVSVIMSARDASQTIGYAADSILSQTHEQLELLICDDCSRDRTMELLRSRYDREPRVRLFCSPASQGPYNVRNHLLAAARGELITFQDADDVALPTRLEEQVRALRDPRRVACSTRQVRVTADGRFVFFRQGTAVRLSAVSLMIGRDRLRALGGFRPARYGADHELYQSLRHRFGARGVAVLDRTHIVLLASSSSLTRHPGAEALETGYRSPARRRYMALVHRLHATGRPRASEAEIEQLLRESDNLPAPAPIAECGPEPGATDGGRDPCRFGTR